MIRLFGDVSLVSSSFFTPTKATRMRIWPHTLRSHWRVGVG